MKVTIVSTYDEKAGAFSQPMFYPKKEAARRAFSDATADKQTMLSKHPSDYKLYKIGEFDELTGELINCPQPEYICCGSDFVE